VLAAASNSGSPAVRRTTLFPVFAASTMRLHRSAFVGGRPDAIVDRSTTDDPSRKRRASSGSGGASTMTTSARPSSSAARNVNNAGSPGPPPTNATVPGCLGIGFIAVLFCGECL
jgi:hypothetical protein